jgi:hypothetical protein
MIARGLRRTRVVAVAIMAALVAVACGGATSNTAPAAPSLSDWHDSEVKNIQWACDGGILLYRSSWNPGTGADTAYTLTAVVSTRCQK